MLSGAYKIPAIQINITGCFIETKMATDAYRGAGRPEATYVVDARWIWSRPNSGSIRRGAPQEFSRSK